jgi:hypothetical protein
MCREVSRFFSLFLLIYTGAPGSLAKESALPLGRFRGSFVSSTRTAGTKTLVNVDNQEYYRCFYFRGGLRLRRGHFYQAWRPCLLLALFAPKFRGRAKSSTPVESRQVANCSSAVRWQLVSRHTLFLVEYTIRVQH